MSYRLTIKDIKENLDRLGTLGEPLFRFTGNIEQTCFPLEDFKNTDVCPVEETQVFEEDLKSHFSRHENAKYIPMNNANLLYFLMGGNRRIVSDNTYMSRLINAKLSSEKFYGVLVNDLVSWKLAPAEDGGRRFVNCSKKGVPDGAVSLIDYIVQKNNLIIGNFCNGDSQDALHELLREYARNICGTESPEPECSDVNVKPAIMDQALVKTLAEFLDLLAALAEASKGRGELAKYLAEGLN